MKKSLLLAIVFALLTGPAFAQTSLDVNASAAMNGTTQGLEVMFDDTDTSAAYVRDNSPNNESVYRAGFWIDPNSAAKTSGANGRLTSLLLARGGDNGASTAARILVQLQAFYGNYKIRAVCADNTNLTRRRARDPITNRWGVVIPDGPHYVTVEAVFANNRGGICRMTVNGETQEQDNYQSYFGDIEEVRLGAPRDIAALTGSIYLDEFESFRTLAP